jgi:hypothetical protein
MVRAGLVPRRGAGSESFLGKEEVTSAYAQHYCNKSVAHQH